MRFFFFQAEDGIRDSSVTGVQTCALPISESCRAKSLLLKAAFSATYEPDVRKAIELLDEAVKRSEERRVGEEGRSRWSPYHLKKKKSDYAQRDAKKRHKERQRIGETGRDD